MKKRAIQINRVYDTREAASILNINQQTLLRYIRSKKIFARKIGEWKILGQNIVNFLMKK